jgi:hypothetical protein
MAALTTQSGNLVWQKVKNYLSNVNIASKGVNPVSQEAFLGLKKYLAQNKRNPDLQFSPIDGTLAASDGGNTVSNVLISSACTLFAIYLVKKGSVETIFKLSNNATTAAGDGTQDLAIAQTVAGDVVEIYPDGRALSAGATFTEQTTRTTTTQTLLANQQSGFAIFGA